MDIRALEEEVAAAKKAAEDTRKYHVVRINERTNEKTILSATPMTHSEAVNFKNAQSKYDWARDQLEEVLTKTAKTLQSA